MAELTMTPEQRRAVDARGGDITLSAAAGSGKTRVLTERAVDRMLDPAHAVEADRMLIVTFTNAAAAEMKSRITKRMFDYLAAHPQHALARRQASRLGRAEIGTVHSLCSRLLRENFQQANLPASFRLGAEDEIELIRQEAAAAALEEAYAEETPAFTALAALFQQRGNDRSLSDTILGVLASARSHPYYRVWLDQKLAYYRDFESVAGSIWAELLFDYAKTLVRCEMRSLDDALSLIERDGPSRDVYLPIIRNDRDTLGRLTERIAARDWDGAFAVVAAYEKPNLSKLKGRNKCDKAIAREVTRLHDHAKELLVKTLPKKVFLADEEGFAGDVAELLPLIDCLFSLVRRTDERIQSEKLAAGVIDFADLEQLTCELLTNEDGTPTPFAAACGDRWQEVMVDEAQDLNDVQERILRTLAAKSGLFCVGDVKQSIYRFRMARPQLFLDRIDRSVPYDGAHFPAVLYLNGNFRTAPAVTDVINDTFSALMSREMGELDYDETQRLEARGAAAPGIACGVHLCVLDQNGAPDDADDDFVAAPAWVAQEIARLLREGAVSDGENKAARRVRASDIAILLHSPATDAEPYRRALRKAGIDSHLLNDAGFFEASEVATVLNALTAIANPLRDVELLGTMSSPLYGFTDDELAAMRISTREGPLYRALIAAAETDGHAADFLRELGELRRLSRTLPPQELIGELLRRTGFDVLCRGMKNGAQREANLRLLQQLAGQERIGTVAALDGFLRYVDRLRGEKARIRPAAVQSDESAVTITSIHRAKGLEWPIVFLCGTEREHGYYRHAGRSPTLLHAEYGFACNLRDHKLRRNFLSVPLAALRAEEERAALSEELRLLYVAMTRAKEQLYLVGSDGKPAGRIENAVEAARGRQTLSPAAVREARCYLTWLLEALALRYDLAALAKSGGTQGGLQVLLPEAQALSAGRPDEADAPAPAPDEDAARALCERMTRPYPYADAAALPAKLAVSAITHGDAGLYFTRKPRFLTDGALTGAARGTAIHTFLQYCDYGAARDDPAAEIARLLSCGVLTERQAQAVDLAAVRTFFSSALARRIFAADRVLREYAMLTPASVSPLTRQYALAEGEETMLQGIADCVLLEGKGAVLLDYKTDRVADFSQLIDRYRMQILLYRDMLAASLRMPVTECWLYSFALGQEIKVEA